MVGLRRALLELEAGVVARHAEGVDFAALRFSTFVNDSGYECLADGTRCQGDCRDTIYAKATFEVQSILCNKTGLPCRASRDAFLSDEEGDHFIVVGVNHKATNHSLYASLTAYSYPKLASVGMVTDARFTGSATRYLPKGHPAAPYLYAVKFARRCADADADLCVVLPESVPAGQPDRVPLPPRAPVVWIERMYINPKTSSGPAVAETVLPILIHFKRRA